MMTDADLCKALLGWRPAIHLDIHGWALPGNEDWRSDTPDFAHDAEWAMKLARAACEKWNLCYSLNELPKADGWRVYAEFLQIIGDDQIAGDSDWTSSAIRHEEAAAIRAAVVKVVKAHEAKGDSAG